MKIVNHNAEKNKYNTAIIANKVAIIEKNVPYDCAIL